ncbi:MAG TPA: hypothetical protein VGQ59_09935 [Cyclobacteriaceae bacterium]|jgi:hypothetical protein|nr:hypothetical protein [Cyclobacteriaceae bacterium]
MKKTSLAALAAIFFLINSQAQSLFIPSGGIGTSTSSNVGVGGGNTGPIYGRFQVNQSSDASDQGIAILNGSGGRSMRIWTDSNNSYIYSNGAGTSPIILNNGGSVGIGTTSPSAGLDIFKSSTNDLALQVNSSGPGWGSGIQFKNTSANGKTYGFYSGQDGSFHLADVNNSIDRLAIGSNGYVGIGTTTPSSMLDIQSGPATSALRLQGGLPYNTYYLDVTPFLRSSPWTVGYSFNLKSSDGAWDNVLSMIGGNVGIGNNNPDAKLTVSGQVHAQEVKVTVNAPGPDYVFEKDYKLTSLEEIKNYIDQNRHLPEIPSAKEMEKNGVQLGEMNMLLLKKIEELTLYMIDIKKESNNQNNIIRSQQQEIDELKSIIKKGN